MSCSNLPAIIGEGLAAYRPRERRAILEYYVDYNWRAACVRAGYANSSNAGYYEGLRKKLETAIEFVGEHMQASLIIRDERILAELAILAFHNPLDLLTEVNGVTEVKSPKDLGDLARVISGIKRVYNHKTKEETLEIKLYSKQAALDTLAKIAGMYKDGNSFGPVLNFQVNLGGSASGGSPPDEAVILHEATPPSEAT